MAHKIRMDELKAQTELEKAKAQTIKTQMNIQDNVTSTVWTRKLWRAYEKAPKR